MERGINKKDLLILSCLRRNARETLTGINRELGIPVSSTYEKLKRFKGGIVKKYTAIVDFDEWYAEYKGLPEKIASDEQKHAGERILLLLREGGEVEKRIDAIEKVVEAQKSCSSRLDLFGKTPEDVRSELLKEVGRLRCISEEIRKQREVIGRSKYSRYTEFWHAIDKYKGEEKLQTTLNVAASRV